MAKILRDSGADVGELYGYVNKKKELVLGFSGSKVKLDREQPRLLLKRPKVNGSPERLVPIPIEVAKDLAAYLAKQSTGKREPVFQVENRKAFEDAHERARSAIDRPDLRLKDFRHLAAISWARAGFRLENIKTWLGHSSIRQTEVYARFAPDDRFDAPLVAAAAQLSDSSSNTVAA